MIDYISGKIIELSPTYCVIDNAGIGYLMEISLQTYDSISGKSEAVIYIQKQVNQRDGSEVDYGFSSKEERNLFRDITSVSGMGAASARMILSSMSPEELKQTILSEGVNRLKSVKGIGLKSAQRLVLELKDKIVKGGGTDNSALFSSQTDSTTEEAISALVMLGFTKANVTKAVNSVLKEKPNSSLEEIIKYALKKL